MITVNGLNETIERLSRIDGGNDGSSEKLRDLVERIARLGVSVAWQHYTNGDLDGNYDFNVEWLETGDNSACVIASGEDVLFLEFGTGALYAQPYPNDEHFEPIFKAGDWSKLHKRQWDNPKGWYYYSGQKYPTHGIAPKMGMYYAKKEMENNIDLLIREVFGND